MLSAPGMVPAAASSRDRTSKSRARPEARSDWSSGSETLGPEKRARGTVPAGLRGCGPPRPSPGPARGDLPATPLAPPLPGAPRACSNSGATSWEDFGAGRLGGTSSHGARSDPEPQERSPSPPRRLQHLSSSRSQDRNRKQRHRLPLHLFPTPPHLRDPCDCSAWAGNDARSATGTRT